MASDKADMDESVSGAVRAVEKAERRLAETKADLRVAVKAALKDKRITPRQAAALGRSTNNSKG